MKKTFVTLAVIAVLAILSGCGWFGKSGNQSIQTVSTMTAEQLEKKMPGADTIVLDVRTPGSYAESKERILGAIRVDPNDSDIWSAKFPRDKTYVLYCS